MNLQFSAASPAPPRDRATGVTLLLGPTNTGKTHFAIERMLAHRSGMIGLPLRLLAREVYNRVVEKVGVEAVALITGEEKIKPRQPRYWVCTVEAMPRDLDLAFVAIDEIQLAADLDRGHVFTDRILNRRGLEETLLIGAQTMERALTELLPGVKVVTRPRLSKLSFAGEKKLARLPPRTAVVAFSAEEVYAIAELIRRQRGGAAVVLGALSPPHPQRADRNVSIGRCRLHRRDRRDRHGAEPRRRPHRLRRRPQVRRLALSAPEPGGVSARSPAAPGATCVTARSAPPAAARHSTTSSSRCWRSNRFEPVRMLQWRNATLELESIEALTAALDRLPGENGLTRAPMAADQIALDIASRDPEVRKVARKPRRRRAAVGTAARFPTTASCRRPLTRSWC